MSRKVLVFYPGRGLSSASLTGTACDLQCEHCRGHFLKGMKDASRPGDLLRIGAEALSSGKKGMLISGGCDTKGKLPLMERLEELTQICATGLRTNVHTGLVSREEAIKLSALKVDRFSMDLHTSDPVVKDVLHLTCTSDAYRTTLEHLCEAAPGRVAPHICAGMEGDTITNEKTALDLADRKGVASIILLRHMPTSAAPLRPNPPLSDDKFLELVSYAVRCSSRPILLGCMRPRGNPELETRCVELGVYGIASPSEEAVRRLVALGYEVVRSDLCCALHL